MISTTPAQTNADLVAKNTSHMNAFQWLLVLGFPPATAAASVMPELFTADENTSAEEVDSVLASVAA